MPTRAGLYGEAHLPLLILTSSGIPIGHTSLPTPITAKEASCTRRELPVQWKVLGSNLSHGKGTQWSRKESVSALEKASLSQRGGAGGFQIPQSQVGHPMPDTTSKPVRTVVWGAGPPLGQDPDRDRDTPLEMWACPQQHLV